MSILTRRWHGPVRSAACAAAAAVWANVASATDYTYTTPNSSTTVNWSAGTSWSPTGPVSGNTNGLIFTVPTTTGITHVSNNDLAGTFVLNTLTFSGTGPAGNSATATLSVTGNALDFQANGGTNPTVNLNANIGGSGTPTPTLTAGTANNITLSNDTTFAGNGSATFSFTGLISGSGAMVKSGSSAFGMSGANTFSGGFTISAGTIRLSGPSAGAVGAITSSPIGTGALILNGGNIRSGDSTARTVLNAVTFGGNVTLGDGTQNGTLTFSAPGVLTGSRTLTVNSSVTYNGDLSETPAASNFVMTKTGGGNMTLAGNNTYGGGTVINGGGVIFNTTGSIAGSGANVTVNAAGAAAGGTSVTPDVILGRLVTTSAGALALASNSAVNLDFTNYPNLYLGATTASTYTGTVTPAGGSYRLGGGGATITLSNNNALTGGNNLAVNAGSASFVVLSGSNDFSGSVTVGSTTANSPQQILRLANNNALANVSGVTVNNNLVSGSNTTHAVQISNGVTITGRTITIGSNTGQGALQTSSAATNTTGTWAGPVILSNDAARVGTGAGTSTLIISGQISSSGAFAPAVRTDNTAGVVRFGAANTYTGANTQAVVGTLQTAAAGALPSTTSVTIGNNASQGSAALDLFGTSQSVVGVTTVSGVNIPATITNSQAGLSTLTVNPTASISFGSTSRGTVSGNLALVKANTGTWTLTGPAANTYTGGTSVTGGTLTAASNGVLGAGDVSVAATVSASTTLDLSNAALTTGAIADAANLVLTSNGAFFGRVAFATSTLAETVSTLTVDGVGQAPGTYTQSNLPNFITGSGSIVVLNPVPEPGTVGLLALGAVGFLSRRRRSK